MGILRIAIGGGQGRMGGALRALVEKTSDLAVALVTVAAGQTDPQAVAVAALENSFDIWIDFTTPVASLHHLAACLRLGKPMVLGTTGFTVIQEAEIQAASTQIPIVYAANMSIGMNLCQSWVAQAAQVFGLEAQISISEKHHQYKIDAPSGTALTLGKVMAAARGQSAASFRTRQHG